MNQLLSRLRSEFQLATDPIQRAELLAQLSGQLARTGEFAEARQLIAELRLDFGDGHSGRATVWIMLAEGLIQYYSELSPAALDRINRAQVLAIGMRYSKVVALASAWRAHVEFVNSRYDDMIKSLELGLANASEADHDAQTRLAIVISNSLMICGDRGSAQRWFNTGREHAVKNGDQASLEALQFNRASFGLMELRVQSCVARISSDQIRSIRLEVESAKNFQVLTGIGGAVAASIYLSSARLFILEGKYGMAIEALGEVGKAPRFAERNFNQQSIDLDKCFCLLHLQDVSAALQVYHTIDFAALDGLDLDDQLVAAWIRLQMCLSDQRFGVEHELRALVDKLSASYTAQIAALRSGLQTLLSKS